MNSSNFFPPLMMLVKYSIVKTECKLFYFRGFRFTFPPSCTYIESLFTVEWWHLCCKTLSFISLLITFKFTAANKRINYPFGETLLSHFYVHCIIKIHFAGFYWRPKCSSNCLMTLNHTRACMWLLLLQGCWSVRELSILNDFHHQVWGFERSLSANRCHFQLWAF